ncbi:putative glycoside hydrolase [Kitasatospora sp. GP82]|uniref:putative glycoside hydrolase n=1 Tax=Kitasatospora sp. GP82 TaxID=3035089 RepID=UPI002474CD39|nr:putative glycoside hydrolase [Kitasatospora sp. GP82]
MACAALGAFALGTPSAGIHLQGVRDNEWLNAATAKSLDLVVTADDDSALDTLKVTLDGRPVPAHRQDGKLHVQPPALADGQHRLSLRSEGPLPFTGTTVSRTFTIATTSPVLQLDKVTATRPHTPVTVHGTAKDAARVEVNGITAPVGPHGTFSVTVADPPPLVKVIASDRAGNTATDEVHLARVHPLLRAAHLTAIGWTSDVLRNGILDLIQQKKLNAVELDIKDENGEIGYASQVPLAKEIGAVKGYYDARATIDALHKAGAQVVGRIVAFRDPILATASWQQGHHERVVQTPGGEAYHGGNYGQLAFTNFADRTVRDYNQDLAAEAAGLGFDDILYDYVRRPDGPLPTMVFPTLGSTTPEQSIADFVAETRSRISDKGTFLGVSVFGIAATRPNEIAQEIGALAKEVDYIAPMVYPSHWGPGEYNVPDPNSHPYDIVQRSLADFARKTDGTQAQVIPWLQDFSLGVHYGPREVADQIQAAAHDGMPSFLLWNAGARYQGEALSIIP